jgi:hypothetical protein
MAHVRRRGRAPVAVKKKPPLGLSRRRLCFRLVTKRKSQTKMGLAVLKYGLTLPVAL